MSQAFAIFEQLSGFGNRTGGGGKSNGKKDRSRKINVVVRIRSAAICSVNDIQGQKVMSNNLIGSSQKLIQLLHGAVRNRAAQHETIHDKLTSTTKRTIHVPSVWLVVCQRVVTF